MKWDLHVSGEVSEEAWHSLGLDEALCSSIKVIESCLEVLINIVLSSLAFEPQMRLEDFISGWEGILWLEDELSSWLSIISGGLSGVLVIHGPHELVATLSLNIELFW